MTFEDLKVWAERGFPVRVRGQDLFVQTDVCVLGSGRLQLRTLTVNSRPFARNRDLTLDVLKPDGFDAEFGEVEILTGADGARVAVKEKLS